MSHNMKRKRDDNNRHHRNSNNNNKHKPRPKTNQNEHRFGRVMHQPPKLQLNPHTTSKDKKVYPTVSIAIPGSVICNAQTRELQTSLAGSIARAAAVYRVDEIVVFDDGLGSVLKTLSNYRRGAPTRDHVIRKADEMEDGKHPDEDVKKKEEKEHKKEQPSTDPHAFLARILQYCECPQYLRRKFFLMHPDLQFAGLLPPLDMPHHLRRNDVMAYREGVVTDEEVKSGEKGGSLVDCGVPNRLIQ
jgi:predicted SPOUT superfamily RNA methylase MTH1